jgi:hypothetical protein
MFALTEEEIEKRYPNNGVELEGEEIERGDVVAAVCLGTALSEWTNTREEDGTLDNCLVLFANYKTNLGDMTREDVRLDDLNRALGYFLQVRLAREECAQKLARLRGGC